MTLADIPSGEVVFIDANILIFYFRPDPVLGSACSSFLNRVEIGDIHGITSSHILTEMTHRLMADEAVQRFGWPMQGIARRLRSHPAQVRTHARPAPPGDSSASGDRLASVTRRRRCLPTWSACE